jgi:hypothetical protein
MNGLALFPPQYRVRREEAEAIIDLSEAGRLPNMLEDLRRSRVDADLVKFDHHVRGEVAELCPVVRRTLVLHAVEQIREALQRRVVAVWPVTEFDRRKVALWAVIARAGVVVRLVRRITRCAARVCNVCGALRSRRGVNQAASALAPTPAATIASAPRTPSVSASAPPTSAPKGVPPQAIMRAVTFTRPWSESGMSRCRSVIPFRMIVICANDQARYRTSADTMPEFGITRGSRTEKG